MNSIPLRPVAALALAALAAALPAHGDPLYRSAFDAARPHTDPRAVDWRTANDQMATLGGHAGHLRTLTGSSTAAAVHHDHGRGSGTAAKAAGPDAAEPRPAVQHAHGAAHASEEGSMAACPMHARMHEGTAHGPQHSDAAPRACHGAAAHPGGAR